MEQEFTGTTALITGGGTDLEDALTTVIVHGTQIISEPWPTRRADTRFAYLADPEHNL